MRRPYLMKDGVDIKNYFILDFYEKIYLNNQLCVNRKYQRKLVWRLEDKKYFINSILHGYPVPIFLFARYIENNNEQWDIIDGLQRLNAITAFIEGEFSIKYGGKFGYFNLEVLSNDVGIKQKTPVLPRELCWDFVRYQLAFSVTGREDSEVDEIFKRINSTGRLLSKQDLRQAGTTGYFSDLVRRTAEYIRGDYTVDDVIPFKEMSKYSLSNQNLDYGIDFDSVVWVKNDIITDDRLRVSADEEIIAHIYMYLLSDGEYAPSSYYLNEAYNLKSKVKKELDSKVKTEDDVIKWMSLFAKTFQIINSALDSKTFHQKLFTDDEVSNKNYCFIYLFCAIAKLLVESKCLKDANGFSSKLEKFGDEQFNDITTKESFKRDRATRDKLIERAINVLGKFFEDDYDEISVDESMRIVNVVMSASESSMFDFKVGVTDFKTGEPSETCIRSIVKDLAAMANTKPGEEGTVVLGVPNNASDVKKVSKRFGITPARCGDFCITGIRDEADRYFGGLEQYQNFIRSCIEREPVSDTFKSEILGNMRPVRCSDKIVILFTARATREVYYDRELYVRHNSHNTPVEFDSEQQHEIADKFSKVRERAVREITETKKNESTETAAMDMF